MSNAQGGSFLAEAASSAPVNGTPAEGGTSAPPADGAQAAVQDAIDGPPEWAPKKYWDPEKKQVRVEELGRGYASLEKLLGREKVPLPADDDDKEGWERWWKATGRPDSPDGYEFKAPELPQDLPYDKESEQNFRTWAHVNGLSKKQANNLYEGYVKHQIERHAGWSKEQQNYRNELEIKLQREYGNKLDAVKQRAGMVVRENADPEFHEFLNSTGLGNDPRMIRFMDKIGQKITGDTRLKGAPPQQAQPQDFQRAIADFRDKHKDALYDKDHPNHAIRVTEYNKLFEGAYGTDPANG